MTRPKPCVLIIDDEEIMREVVAALLVEEGYQVVTAGTGEEGLEKLQEEVIDLVILDLMLPGKGGLVTLEEILQDHADTAVVMISAYASVENAVTATKLGAFDFVTKPFKNEQLMLVVKNGLNKRALEMENQQLRKVLKERFTFKNIVGKSEEMQSVFNLISQVAPGRSTVLIEGESGTGKELVAKAIHACSARSDGPFVAVNSSSIPGDLLESELFGHVRGAFTGASSSKKGLFEIADAGTIFLDEVGTLPVDTQVKLLRVIQEREFRRVGGLKNISVDVRIIAATNIELKEAVDRQEFREDLYYRLNVFPVKIPPLRDRLDDLPLLVEHFLNKFHSDYSKRTLGLSDRAWGFLKSYAWPGNIRELENVIERGVILTDNNESISLQSLFAAAVPELAVEGEPDDHVFSEGQVVKSSTKHSTNWIDNIFEDQVSLDEVEKILMERAMAKAKNNISGAARLLGLTRPALAYRLKKYEKDNES